MVQVFICFGIIIPSSIALLFDSEDAESQELLLYILILLPAILAAIQIVLMITVFRHDTPNVMK